MASNVLGSPKSPGKQDKRRSFLDQFPNLEIVSNCSSMEYKMTRKLSSCIRGSFSRGWPPVSKSKAAKNTFNTLPFTLRMSQDYRVYPDRWRVDESVEDKPADVSDLFKFTEEIMNEISEFIQNRELEPEHLEVAIIEEMAISIFGSNNIERAGMGLDDTMIMCMSIFKGDEDLEYTDR
jgi:hypothetical protein